MAREREVVSLGDICDFRAGTTFRPSFQGQLSGRYPFVKVSDMNLPANTVRIQDANNWVSEADVRELRAKPFPPKTVVFAKIGEALRQNRLRQVVRETIIDNNMMGAIPRGNRVDPDFFYYALSQFDFSDIAQGTALPYLTLPSLARLTLAIPCIDEQRAIASILGALDDKIELNRQTNETLEAMARALFKSWFIDFDPVHAKAEGRDPGLPADVAALFPDSFQDSELGQIPKGWTAGRFGNVVSQRTVRLRNRPAIVLSAMAAGELVNSDEHFTKRVYSQEIGKYLAVEQWDFAYNPSRVNIGSIGMLKEPLLGGVSPVYVVFRPEAGYRWFVEFNVRQSSTKQWINTLASGSVRQSLSYADFASLPCVIPPETTIARFDKVWAGFRASILSRSDESRTLATLRDTLLPKLLSGELRLGAAGLSMSGTTAASSVPHVTDLEAQRQGADRE